MNETEYRIEYVVQRMLPEEEDFSDIGFGSSGGWGGVQPALHAASTDIQRYSWETERGMPDPEDIEREQQES